MPDALISVDKVKNAQTKTDAAPEQYRVLDYAAYYRYVKARLQTAVINIDHELDHLNQK